MLHRIFFFFSSILMSPFLSMPHTPLSKPTTAKRRDLTQWDRTGCVKVPGFGSLTMPIAKWVFLQASPMCLSLLLHFTAQKLKSAELIFPLTGSISEWWANILTLLCGRDSTLWINWMWKINLDRASWSIKPISCFLPPANVTLTLTGSVQKPGTQGKNGPSSWGWELQNFTYQSINIFYRRDLAIVTTPAVHWPSYVWVLTFIRVFPPQQTALLWSHALSLPILPSRGIFVPSEKVRDPNVHLHEGRAEIKWVHTCFLFWQPLTMHHLTWWL